MIRVFLADGHDDERIALCLFLSDLAMRVVGEATDWPTTLAEAPATLPDMLVVDWGLLLPHPQSALQEFRLACLTTVVIVLIGHSHVRRQVALSSGADHFISKGETPDRVAEKFSVAAASVRPRVCGRECAAAESWRITRPQSCSLEPLKLNMIL